MKYWLLFSVGTSVVMMVLCSGCAHSVMVPRTAPAEIPLPNVKRISIYEIEGRDGELLQSEISEKMVRSDRFDVLERSDVDKILAELGADIDQAFTHELEFGKLLPASAIVVGGVHRSDFSDHVERSTYKCDKRTCTTWTRKGKAIYKAGIRVLHTESGKVLAAKTLEAERTDQTNSSEGQPPPIDQDRLLDSCREDAADQFFSMVAPHTVMEKIHLVSDGDLPELEQGNAYLGQQDVETAIAYYERAYSRVENAPEVDLEDRAKARYALALGLALRGDYPEAIRLMQEAIRMNPGPGFFENLNPWRAPDWITVETRIKQWQKEAEELKRQTEELKRAQAAVVARD